MFSDYVLRIYASQNAPVTSSCPVSGPILMISGVAFWHRGVGGGGGRGVGGCAIGFSDACDNSGMLASYNMTSLCLTYDRSISAHVCS